MNIRRTLGTLALGAALAVTGCDDIVGAGGDATLIVENKATVSASHIYISDCGNETWGDDWLGPNETIPPGGDRAFEVDAGCYDLRARFLDGTYAQSFEINLEDGDEFTWELVD
ncbi:MAG TPA: hypothetical protein VF039_14340 [Longimicrobiales bacterium]